MDDRPPIQPPERRRTRRLSEVLKQLMARANLRQSELARRSGISEQTLTNLLRGHDTKGKPTFPNPDTLKHLALGLATNGLRERDMDRANRAYAELMEAIGYLDAPSLAYAPPLPTEVVDLLRANADLAIEIAQTADIWSPEATNMLREAIASYRARKVQRSEPPNECAN